MLHKIYNHITAVLKIINILHRNQDKHYRVPSVDLCVAYAEPELTARPWFAVLYLLTMVCLLRLVEATNLTFFFT